MKAKPSAKQKKPRATKIKAVLAGKTWAQKFTAADQTGGPADPIYSFVEEAFSLRELESGRPPKGCEDVPRRARASVERLFLDMFLPAVMNNRPAELHKLIRTMSEVRDHQLTPPKRDVLTLALLDIFCGPGVIITIDKTTGRVKRTAAGQPSNMKEVFSRLRELLKRPEAPAPATGTAEGRQAAFKKECEAEDKWSDRFDFDEKVVYRRMRQLGIAIPRSDK